MKGYEEKHIHKQCGGKFRDIGEEMEDKTQK